ncbi:hypothetical protein [Massilia antarctica]|uniref:hypothetical protein n=1 Tax=Massilia antarctica TaxID=2765360 RepID=UPI0006BB607F|nr:hypothetical protein [Massilia sp. H27-R4]MCY0912266.1 hypothetical protein [Massilia sp. H27-R4]CUI06236.1 hypothetical protein BN2497_7249 [Janthinobacterium sp. CG23_2]CUU30022.1 hypothetical protein BN3177_7249 [Janthinobacterium sp. CG23_2]
MNHRTLIAAFLAATVSAHVSAENFGSATVVAKPSAPVAPAAPGVNVGTPAMAAPAPAATAGPQAAEAFRIVKPDGVSIVSQGTMGSNVLTGTAINVSDKDAFLVSAGKCAFNVKYDEISATAAVGTTNRLFSNDKLVAQNTKIDLSARVLKTIWTQPYLSPGLNNVKVVVNAESAMPSIKWIRVTVAGTCGAAPVAAPVASAPAVKPAEPTAPAKPAVTVPPAPPVQFAPGSGEWNNLTTMWGYSNYAVTQLKSANYPRYAELSRLNAALTAAMSAKTVERGAYNSLITAWNTFVTETQFKTLMATAIAGNTGKK